MKRKVLFMTGLFFACFVYAYSGEEDCRSYIIDLSINKKYCIASIDEAVPGIVQKEIAKPEIQQIPEIQEVQIDRSEIKKWEPFVDTAPSVDTQHEIPDPITPEERSMMK